MTQPFVIQGGLSSRRGDTAVINLDDAEFQRVQAARAADAHTEAEQDSDVSLGTEFSAVQPTWLQAVGDRISSVSVSDSLVRRSRLNRARREGREVDWDAEQLYNRLEREGLISIMDDKDLLTFSNITTQQQFDLQVANLIERAHSQGQIEDLGFLRGLAAEMVAYSADPITFGVDLAIGGSSRGAALARFMQAGSRAALANGLVELALVTDDRALRPAEIGFAAAAGFAVGGVLGTAFGQRPTPPSAPVDAPIVNTRAVTTNPDLTPQPSSLLPMRMFTDEPLPIRRFMDGSDNRPGSRSTRSEAPAETPTQQARPTVDDELVALRETASRRLNKRQYDRTKRELDTLRARLKETEGLDPRRVDAEMEQLRSVHRFTDNDAGPWEREAMQRAETARLAERQQLQGKVEELETRLREHNNAGKARNALRSMEWANRPRPEEAPLDALEPMFQLEQSRLEDMRRNPLSETIMGTVEVQRAVRQTQEDMKSIGAAQAQDTELMHDTMFGFHRDTADSFMDSLGPEYSPGRMPLSLQLLNKLTPATRAWVTENPAARALLINMYTQPFTRQGLKYNKTGWEDVANKAFKGYEAKRLREHRKGFQEWLRDTTGRGTLRSFTSFKAQKEFAELVGEYTRQREMGNTPDVHPGIKRAGEAGNNFFKDHWANLQRNGAVPKDMPPPIDWYLPQMIDRGQTQHFVNRFLDPEQGLLKLKELYRNGLSVQLRQQVAELIDELPPAQQARMTENLTESLTDMIAEAYARRAYHQDLSITGSDVFDAYGIHIGNINELRNLLHENLVRKGPPNDPNLASRVKEIDDILATLKRNPDKKTSQKHIKNLRKAPRLMKRARLDMNAEVSFRNQRGEVETLRLGDLYQKDINYLAHNYGRWAAAEAAVSRDGFTLSQVKDAVEELRRLGETRKNNPDAPSKADIDALDYGMRTLMNLPAHSVPENVMRTSNMLKSFAYTSKMGSAFVHTIPEAMTIVAQHGVINTLRQMPALMRIVRAYAKGDIDPGVHADLYALNSAGMNSLEFSLGGSRYDTDLTVESGQGWLGRAEMVAEGFKRVASYVNLLPVTTDISRQFANYMAIKDLDRVARGLDVHSSWDGLRRQYGLSDRGLQLLKDHFNSNKVSRNANGEIDWDSSLGIELMPAETRIELENFLYRNATTTIQEVHRGNLPQRMTGPVGSVLLQFRSFEVAATSRHLVADLNRHDMATVNKFVLSTIFASLGYAARVYAFSGGDKDRIEEMLTPERIFMNGVAYSVTAGVIPALVDTVGYHGLGGVTPFNQFRTTGITTAFGANPAGPAGIGLPPAVGLMGDAARVGGMPFQMMWDAASGEDLAISREQMRSITAVMGMDTAWFLRPGREYLLNNLPSERELNRGNAARVFGLEDE